MLEECADILTAAEACEVLRIGFNRIYQILNNGTLKGYRNGRTWRIPKQAIQEYIIENSKLTGWGFPK